MPIGSPWTPPDLSLTKGGAFASPFSVTHCGPWLGRLLIVLGAFDVAFYYRVLVDVLRELALS